MRFQRLEVHSYGNLSHHILDDLAQHSLVVIFGRNEAGKSTIHRAMRDLLFGIPTNTCMTHTFGADGLALEASLLDHSGAKMDITRRKKKPKKERFAGVRTEPHGLTAQLAEQDFLAIAGNIERELYEALFAISLHELEEGAEGLAVAQFDDILASASLGGAAEQLGRVRKDLQDRCESLFKPQGRTQKISVIITKLDDARTKRRSAELSQATYELMLDEKNNLTSEHRTIDAQLEEIRKSRERCSRLLAAFEDVHRLQEVDRALVAREHLIPIQADEVVPLEESLSRIRVLRSRRTETDTQIEDAKQFIATLDVDEQLLVRAFELDALLSKAHNYQQRKKELRETHLDLQQRAERLQIQLAELSNEPPGTALSDPTAPTTTGETSSKGTISYQAILELETWSVKYTGLVTAVSEAKNNKARAERELEALFVARNDNNKVHTAASDTEVCDWKNDLEPMVKSAQRVEDVQRQVKTLRRRNERSVEELWPRWPSGESLLSKSFPSRETIEEHKRRFELLEQELSKVTVAVEQGRADVRNAEEAYLRFSTRNLVPSQEQLSAARDERQKLWGRVRHAWLNESSLRPELADAYESQVLEADSIVDAIRSKAEDAARLQTLQDAVADARARLQTLETRRNRHLEERDSATRAWTELWTGSGVDANPGPSTLAAWRSEVERLRGELQEAENLELSVEQERKEVDAFFLRLGEELQAPQMQRQSLIQLAREHQTKLVLAHGAHQATQQQVARRRREIEECEQTIAQLEPQITRIESQTAILAQELGFRATSLPSVLVDIMRRTVELRAQKRALEEEQEKASQDRRELEQLQDAVTALCQELGMDPKMWEPDVALRMISARMEKEKEKRATKSARARQLEELREASLHLSTELSKEQSKLEPIRARLYAMCSPPKGLRASVASAAGGITADLLMDDVVEHLEEVVANARHRDALAAEKQGIDRRLAHQLGRGAQREADEKLIHAKERSELEVEFEEYGQRASELQARRDSVNQKLGQLDEKLEALGGMSAADAEAEYASLREELGVVVEEYLKARVAHHVLDTAVRLFSEENQPELLTKASLFMEKMTEGRWTRVRHPLESGVHAGAVKGLRLEGASGAKGASRTIHELSTGTREQLFLALRLAFIEQYAKEHEPLPIILDDVLANFDAARARAALSMLRSIKNTQVIYLTCHKETLQLVREVGGLAKLEGLGDEAGGGSASGTVQDTSVCVHQLPEPETPKLRGETLSDNPRDVQPSSSSPRTTTALGF